VIEFKGVSKIYNNEIKAVDNVDLEIQDGEFVCFIGTSGSGKTTALRLINRMHEPTYGEITMNGEKIKTMDPVNLRRKIGYAIQQTGLLPHLTIYENVVTVPRLLEWSEEKCRDTAERLMERVDLPLELLERYPSELSGGQQQRIGVIRALAANPGTVLMDEPFGALDPITRDALHELVIELQEEYNNTFVFVTHDMDEALKLGDRIAIWHEGKVVQYDTPENILAEPANDYVRDFVGRERLFDAKTSNITVKEVMNSNVLTISPGKSVSDALTTMHSKGVDTLFVVDDYDKLMGRVTIEYIANIKNKSRNITEIMDDSIRPLRESTLIQNQLQQVLKTGRSNIPVVDSEGHLTGIITKTTLVNLVYDIIWNQEEIEEEILVEGTSE
jgi:osmoprotectant transport system ATP-binding protein